jgi:PIN domain nuclease of toxin-antitoxin system
MTVRELLIDTCGLVKWMQGNLPKSARSLLINARERHLSVVSAWEILLKQEALCISVSEIVDAITEMSLRVEPLLLDHIAAFEKIRSEPQLPHKDPFDHLLIAQASFHHWPILTCDQRFLAYPGIQVVW